MPDRLTLDEAKAECEIRRLRCLDASTNGYNPAAACAWQDAKAILNRVKNEPDEEGQAVLWLMKKTGRPIMWEGCFKGDTVGAYHWQPDGEEQPWKWIRNPAEEAKKLGWGGGE